MAPRVADSPAPADLPAATASRSGPSGGQSAGTVAAETSGEMAGAHVRLVCGKERGGRAGVGSVGAEEFASAGSLGEEFRPEKEPRGYGFPSSSTSTLTSASTPTLTSALSSTSEPSLALLVQEIALLDAGDSIHPNASAAAAEREGRGDEGEGSAAPSWEERAAGSATAPAGSGRSSSSSSSGHARGDDCRMSDGRMSDGWGGGNSSARRGGSRGSGSRGRDGTKRTAIVTPWGSLVEAAELPCARRGGERGWGSGGSARGAGWGRWGGQRARQGGFSVILSRGDSIEERVISTGGPLPASGAEPVASSPAVARESERAWQPAPGSSSSRPPSSSSSSSSSPPRLFSLCTDSIVAHIDHVSSLRGVPEDIVLLLLWRVLQRGALTEKVLRVFRSAQHGLVDEAIHLLGISAHSVAPVLPTRCTDNSLR
ncbi:hypothetical protein CLOM_g3515 [Closterium sp. NIES-68]|nr:hypothetical protein CLOM_g3515 [Closterium sp. NIES-68]GJP75250.1 hypothetical protein CLOP_g5708 [Closterium sp. NIES-67]